jgi:putative acetyltransferase
MRVRKARLTDAAEIARMHRGTIRAVNSKDYSSEDIAVWSGRPSARRVRESHDIAIRYVAVVGETIIGYTDISKEDPENLWGLYVHKNYIGQGVGSKLLATIQEEAKKLGAKKFVISSTVTAKTFYEKQGFVVIKKDTTPILHRTSDVWILEKIF